MTDDDDGTYDDDDDNDFGFDDELDAVLTARGWGSAREREMGPAATFDVWRFSTDLGHSIDIVPVLRRGYTVTIWVGSEMRDPQLHAVDRDALIALVPDFEALCKGRTGAVTFEFPKVRLTSCWRRNLTLRAVGCGCRAAAVFLRRRQ